MVATRRARAPLAVLLAALGVCACGRPDAGMSGDIVLRSTAFESGGRIPKRHAFAPEGENVSPPLQWSRAPAGTLEFVLIVEDPIPHRETFVHWVAYGIPASATGLPEGIPADQPRAGGLVQGTNDYGHLGWGGPLPPPKEPAHTYWFWVYAIDTHLTLEPGATKKDVLEAMSSGHHILANGRLTGQYSR